MESIGLTLAPAIDALEKTAFFSTLSRERMNLMESDIPISSSPRTRRFRR